MKFTRIYVRRYRDNGQVTAYAEHDQGRTESTAHWPLALYPSVVPRFGRHMHALFNAAKAQGLRLERETWI